MDIQVIQSH